MFKHITSFFLIVFLINVFVMNAEAKATYGPASAGAPRLQLKHDPLKEYCDKHLEKAGLKIGQTVWDIASATGSMTIELAKVVGPSGHVHAFDINPNQLATAKKNVEAAGIKNVTFHLGDIRSLKKDLPLEEPDVVYMRCILSHLEDPKEVIILVKDLLKPGGVVLSIEPIKSTSYNPVQHQIFDEYRGVVKAMGVLGNKDYDIGERLESLYKDAGYTELESYFIEPTMDLATTKDYFLFDISRWSDKAIEAKLLTAEQVDNWKNTIQNWPNKDETFIMAKYAFVIARKAEQ